MERRAPIFSINYDFMQTVPYAKKVLWVQLRYSAPTSLRIGSMVNIISQDGHLNTPSDQLRVIDIVGTRIALDTQSSFSKTNRYPEPPFSPGVEKRGWLPETHSRGTWGYATRDLSDQPYSYRTWTYGNGDPVSYLVW